MPNCPVCKSPLEPVATQSGSCSICGSVFLSDLKQSDPSVDSASSKGAAGAKTVRNGGTAFDNRQIDATLESGYLSDDSEPKPQSPASPEPSKGLGTVGGLDRTIDSTSLP